MLPNLNVVICGIVLSVILFVATGNGIIMPQTYARIGKPPEVSRPIRPMMQRVVTDEPARAQSNAMTAERRDREPARLPPQAAVPVAEPVAASRDGGQPAGEPVMPSQAALVTDSGVANVATAPPVPDLASELRIGGIVEHAASSADMAAAPAPRGAPAAASDDAMATDAVESAPAAAPAASPEAGTAEAAAASTPLARTGEPPGGNAQDAAAAGHDAFVAIPATTLTPAAHAPVRLRRARPAAAHIAAVAPRKPVVRHARPHVPLPAPSPAAAAPNPATPVVGLFGQPNFNAAPPHQ